jgi:hypothetical protein
LWLKEGDASTKFLHAHANGHHRRNCVWSLMVDDEVVVSKERKADATFCYFDQILGMSSPRSNSINLDLLNLPCLDPAGMGACFTEVEVWATIKGLPPDKFAWVGRVHDQIFAIVMGADQVGHHGGVGCLLAPGHV